VSFDPGAWSLYLCTPIREDLAEFVSACVAGGVGVVQLRDGTHEDRDLLDAAVRLASSCRELGVPFIVNDRCDVALAAGADGVHVGQDDLPVRRCRELLGDDAVIGLSTHAPDELDEGIGEPVSYLSAGPVEATPTKPGRPGTGVGYAARAARRAAVPVYVTGGVTTATIPGLVAAGLRHFVVVRALTESPDPRGAARALADSIEGALDATTSGSRT
jgi:thiamine-phosphate pyrophosphorylase